MFDYGLLNLGSLVLGLIAWILPVVNLVKHDKANHRSWAVYSVTSVSACATSLYMQIFYQNFLVRLEDWSALMDTSSAVAFVSATLLVVTIVLNAVSFVIYYGKYFGVCRKHAVMNEHITMRQYFDLADFEEEQAFLTSYHADGWRLISIKDSKYTFERCEKEAVAYQIDFNPNEQQKEEYIQLFTDFGWKFIIERDGRFYISKPATFYNENENKLFSDRETKAAMCKKIVKHKLQQLIPLSIVTVFVSCVMGLILFRYRVFPSAITGFVSLVLLGGLILTLYSKKYLTSFFKLRKMAREDSILGR